MITNLDLLTIDRDSTYGRGSRTSRSPPGVIPKDFMRSLVRGWTLNATGTPRDPAPSSVDARALRSSTVSARCRVMNAYPPSFRPCFEAASIISSEGMNLTSESYMVSPTLVTASAGTFSDWTFLTQAAVGQRRSCDRWSSTLLFTSSAIRKSLDLHPDSR